MGTRSEQFLRYLREHGMKFTIEKVLEETGMNRNILHKAMRELKNNYGFSLTNGIYTVTIKENSESGNAPKLNGFLEKFLKKLQEKGEAGIIPEESGLKATSFLALVSMLRGKGYRIDFENDRYYFKGMDDYSLSHRKGGLPPLKIWSKSRLRKIGGLSPLKIKDEPHRKTPTLSGDPFVINWKVMEESLKNAPKEYITFVRDVVKRITLANAAYVALVGSRIQLANLKGILLKVEG